MDSEERKKKAYVIDKCHHCPNCKDILLVSVEDERPQHKQVCIESGERYEIIDRPYIDSIPDWCPLPDWQPREK